MLITQEKNMSQSNESNGSSVFVNHHLEPKKAVDPHLEPKEAKITFYKGGALSTLEFPKKESKTSSRKRIDEGKRKIATGLSDSARLRFLRKMATVNFFKIKGKVLFLTLTYPKNKWSTNPRVLKRNLQNFRKRLERKYRKVSGFWRLELSGKNGNLNPHFHLLLLGQDLSNKALADIRVFVANSWYEACGKLSDDHLLAGSRVERVKSRREDWDHVTKYIGKKEKLKDEAPETGNVWGTWRTGLLPIELETVKISLTDAVKIRRCMRRLAGKRRGMGLLLQQQVFICYQNMKKLLEFLGYRFLETDHDQVRRYVKSPPAKLCDTCDTKHTNLISSVSCSVNV